MSAELCSALHKSAQQLESRTPLLGSLGRTDSSVVSNVVSNVVSSVVSTARSLGGCSQLQWVRNIPLMRTATAGLTQTMRQLSGIRLRILLPRCSYVAAAAAMLHSAVHPHCCPQPPGCAATKVRPP